MLETKSKIQTKASGAVRKSDRRRNSQGPLWLNLTQQKCICAHIHSQFKRIWAVLLINFTSSRGYGNFIYRHKNRRRQSLPNLSQKIVTTRSPVWRWWVVASNVGLTWVAFSTAHKAVCNDTDASWTFWFKTYCWRLQRYFYRQH